MQLLCKIFHRLMGLDLALVLKQACQERAASVQPVYLTDPNAISTLLSYSLPLSLLGILQRRDENAPVITCQAEEIQPQLRQTQRVIDAWGTEYTWFIFWMRSLERRLDKMP